MPWSIFNRKRNAYVNASEYLPKSDTPTTKPVSDDLTEIVFIVDESGSMHGLEQDTIGGINALLESNKKAEGRAKLSVIMFNNVTRVLHDRVDVESVSPLGENDYRPGGCTALLDAVGGAIDHVDKVSRYMPEGHKPGHVLFAIATDGMENASHKYSYPQVKRLIEEHREKGWEFVFLGANIDVAQTAEDLGIAEDCAMPYSADSAGTAAVYESLARASVSMRSSGKMDKNWSAPVARDNARRNI